jgi:DNA-binding NtrC family response regulator
MKGRAKKTILCGDDDQSILQLYYEELTDESYKVIISKEGKEALAKYSKENPDLVILAIRMPGMDGIHTLTAMLGSDRKGKLILNTAHPQHKENFMTGRLRRM